MYKFPGVLVALLQCAMLDLCTATSIVVTPHCGDHSFSVENEIDEIPATGGHRFHSHSALRSRHSVIKRTLGA